MLQTISENQQLVLDTIDRKPVTGIPCRSLLVMEHEYIERIAGVPSGLYEKDPENVYNTMLEKFGVCMLDQYVPWHPLKMGNKGYETYSKGATTGSREIRVNDMLIDSPEAVVAHLETHVFPDLTEQANRFNEQERAESILAHEKEKQQKLGSTILKTGHNTITFPRLRYGKYGYENYFMAYALYPEMIEKDFRLQADLAERINRAVVRACREGNLPLMHRLDHDMADSRGTFVDIKTLDNIWFPHFARSIQPAVDSGLRLIWHCDGNLMQMLPRLLECGLFGFQGFQYEDNMDYPAICSWKTRDSQDLIIWAGVSVTTTMVNGTPSDIKKELKWLVENGPPAGLILGTTSSITPGVCWENIQAFREGLAYYRTHGRM